MVERIMEVWSGDVRLDGTLSVPDDPGPYPAALLLTGPFDGETPDDLTHVLRRDPHSPGLKRYREQLDRPVDADLVERVATWTKAQLS